MTTAPAIETLGLAKRFGSKTALGDLSLTVARGEVFGFLGPNGAGKTTAIKLLLGLARPSAGAANVLGAPVGDRKTRRGIGYLPELFRYQEWLDARGVLAFHASLLKLSRSDAARRIDEILERVGLHHRANDRVATFSKGMQQRLGLAVALVGEPELIFLDEPTSALDPVGRHDVRAMIEDLRGRGTTVFLNSHLLTEVERTCDRVAFIDRGRIVAEGTIAEIVGAARAVRVTIASASDAVLATLARFGTFDAEPPAYTIHGIDLANVPRLVADLVGAGAAVGSVEPLRASLEDRFLTLLQPPAHVDDRKTHGS